MLQVPSTMYLTFIVLLLIFQTTDLVLPTKIFQGNKALFIKSYNISKYSEIVFT